MKMNFIKLESAENVNYEHSHMHMHLQPSQIYQSVIERNDQHMPNASVQSVIQAPIKMRHQFDSTVLNYGQTTYLHENYVNDRKDILIDDGLMVPETHAPPHMTPAGEQALRIKAESEEIPYYFDYSMNSLIPATVSGQAVDSVTSHCASVPVSQYEPYAPTQKSSPAPYQQMATGDERLLKENCVSNVKIEPKYTCDSCDYRCKSAAILKVHQRKHTGLKPYSCTLCNYRSGQKNNVTKHMLTHLRTKPFKCQYCEYTCIQKNNLVTHERIHTGDKPYKCTHCDYRTAQKPNLSKHLYLHTNEKPYRCEKCSYRCVQKTNLMKHLKKHQGDAAAKVRKSTFRCDVCDFESAQRSTLARHVEYNHGGGDGSVFSER